MTNTALTLAAACLALVGVAHSVLGELLLFLQRLGNLE